MKIKRAIKLWWQRETRGFDDSVCWNLDTELAKWLAPRLRRFKEMERHGLPAGIFEEGLSDQEQIDRWEQILDTMVYAIENYENWGNAWEVDYNDESKFIEGLDNFSKYWMHLWD